MKQFQILVTVLLFINFRSICTMHVADWGVTSDIHRLRFVTRDFFKQLFSLITDDTYNLPDFKQTYEHTLKGKNGTVQFRAYNGRLNDFKIEMINDTKHGALRRLAIARDNHRQHELIVCDQCMYVKADRVNYLYEAYYNTFSTHGRLSNGPILYWLSFQINIIYQHDNQLNKSACEVTFDPITLALDSKHKEYKIEATINNVGVLNFVADKIDEWLIHQLNVTTLNSLQINMKNYAQTTIKKDVICDEFLSE